MNVPDTCYGIFIDINSTLYCSMQNKLQVIKKSLNSNTNIPSIAAGNGSSSNGSYDLNQPLGIFVDDMFRLYVADTKNNRIQRFDLDELNGTTVAGSIETITLYEPTGIVLDADNYLFIVDSKNRRIVGSGLFGFRCVAGCNNSTGTQMIDPRMLSFSPLGTICVTDKSSNKIHFFSLSSNYCSKFNFYVLEIILFSNGKFVLTNK